MEEIKYFHSEEAHNLIDPSVIVPILLDVLKPESVVDIGCGIGTFLHMFTKYGIDDIIGVDGDWVDRQKLSKHISLEKFVVVDLEKGVKLNRKFDLALCLEVVEHLKKETAKKIIRSLTSLSDVIVFSAAIPGQFGQNHINEQYPEYWIEKFNNLGYSFHDVFRPIFWNNKQVARWYKQNMFLVIKKGEEKNIAGFEKYIDYSIKSYVHPEYFNLQISEIKNLKNNYEELNREIRKLRSGDDSIAVYLKLFVKKIINLIKRKAR